MSIVWPRGCVCTAIIIQDPCLHIHRKPHWMNLVSPLEARTLWWKERLFQIGLCCNNIFQIGCNNISRVGVRLRRLQQKMFGNHCTGELFFWNTVNELLITPVGKTSFFYLMINMCFANTINQNYSLLQVLLTFGYHASIFQTNSEFPGQRRRHCFSF